MIYFAGCGELVKIGTTAFSDAQPRISNLQTGNPEPVVLLAQMAGGVAVEADLHRRFHALHVRGEWFRYSDDLRAFIADIDDGAEPYGLFGANTPFFGIFVPGAHYRVVDRAYAQTNEGRWWCFDGGDARPTGHDPIEVQRDRRKNHGERRRVIVCALKDATRFESKVGNTGLQRLLRKAQKVV
jgi:hypothetical protein